MSSIPLTKGRQATVDTADYDYLTEIGSWCYSSSGYAVHYSSDEFGKRTVLYMHRIIMERMLGDLIPLGYQVDHISGAADGIAARLDNRRENLRLATRSQNQAHKGLAVNNTSLYKGISWNQGKWEARIKYGQRRLHLGRYTDAQTAATMYDAAARLLYQDFAGCNFSDQPTPPCIEEQLQAILARYGLAV